MKKLRENLAFILYGTSFLDPKKWKNYCFLWKCLTEEERKKVRKDVLYLNSTAIDLAHIFSRSTHPELKEDISNVVFIARGFHSFLTQKKSFLEGKDFLTEKEVYLYYLKANSLKEELLRRKKIWI